METLFRWIHLSDIHVGHGDAEHGWDQKLVMDALRRDIAAQVKKDHSPIDAIFVTGDIAFSGAGRSPTEYAEAKAWLLALASDAGVTPSQIFVVPGNHDVNRAADKDRNTKRLLESLRNGSDKIDTALADKSDRALLASRMAAYLAFAADFAPADAEERLFWVHRLSALDGLRVRIIGLNTALLAADDQDQGKLRLGHEQLGKALREPAIGEGELVMVLSHHPFRNGWLMDEKDVDAWVRNHTHVHLSGHVHEAESEQARSGAGGTFLRVVAGSAHGDQLPPGVPASHGYSFGAAVRVDDQLKIRIWPRKWSPRNASFRVDADNVPDGEKLAEHDVRVSLPPTQRPTPTLQTGVPRPSPPLAAKGPGPVANVALGNAVNVFISHCPEDEPLARELEKQLTPLRRKGLIAISSSTSVAAGEVVRESIERHLALAQVILLLISADYLASEDCYEIEVEGARAEAERRGAKVIPILLRPSDFSDLRSRDDAGKAWFEKLNPLPRDGKPVTSSPDRDQAFAKIAREIKSLVETLKGASK
jgi:hypothetical protein